jgi:hypothetical protein
MNPIRREHLLGDLLEVDQRRLRPFVTVRQHAQGRLGHRQEQDHHQKREQQPVSDSMSSAQPLLRAILAEREARTGLT